MSHVVSKTVVTIADGSATEFTPTITGKLNRILYEKASSGGYDNGIDVTITIERTSEQLFAQTDMNASVGKAPRLPTHDNAGVASLYAAGGEPIEDNYVLANDRIKIVVAQGGNVKTGTFHFYFE